MADWINLKEKASTLPPGHIGIQEAEEACRQEYAECHARVSKWLQRKTFKKMKCLSLEEALKLISNLLYIFGETKKVKIILESREVSRFAAAHYNPQGRVIHFPTRHIWVDTLLHEFTHFLKYENEFPGSSHGKEFCDLQDMVFSAVEELREVRSNGK
jgi:hypothetical protein